MGKELFSLYYINLEKVYELRMIRNNMVLENRVMENKTETNSQDRINAGLSIGINGIFSADVGTKTSVDNLKSIKVSDSFTVKQTKSNILYDILGMAEQKQDLSIVSDGDLIRLDHLKLQLENEQLIRMFKVLSRDIIKGQVATNGIDINKILNSLAKDYSYLLSTVFDKKNIIMKIPMSGEGEFENKYSIDDLLIGNVSIIGVYKGIIRGSEINSTFDFFVNLGNTMGQLNESEDEIQSSSDEVKIASYNLHTTLKENEDYIFIDLMAIVQNIKVKEDDKSLVRPTPKPCLLKRIFRRR